MSDLATSIVEDYVREMDRKRETGRVSMTIRVEPELKERLERIAADMGQSVNAVSRDVLELGSLELCRAIVGFTGGKHEHFEALAYGKNYPAGEGK